MKNNKINDYILMFGKTPATFTNGDIIIYGDKKEAIEDSQGNIYSKVIKCIDAPKEIQNQLFLQINK